MAAAAERRKRREGREQADRVTGLPAAAASGNSGMDGHDGMAGSDGSAGRDGVHHNCLRSLRTALLAAIKAAEQRRARSGVQEAARPASLVGFWIRAMRRRKIGAFSGIV